MLNFKIFRGDKLIRMSINNKTVDICFHLNTL